MSPTLKLSTLLFIGLLSQGSALQAEETEEPSLELLEFLGSFESSDGEWIDPMAIEELSDETNMQYDNEEKNDE